MPLTALACLNVLPGFEGVSEDQAPSYVASLLEEERGYIPS